MRNVYVEIVGDPSTRMGPRPVSEVQFIAEAVSKLVPGGVLQVTDAGNVLPFRRAEDDYR